jgi:hypothetical protein
LQDYGLRALTNHFEELLVLDRDRLPEGSDFRTGVPQAHQCHTLLLAGLLQVKEWFPGLKEKEIAVELGGNLQRLHPFACPRQRHWRGPYG